MKRFLPRALLFFAFVLIASCLIQPFSPFFGEVLPGAQPPAEAFNPKSGGPRAYIDLNSASVHILLQNADTAPFAEDIIALREELGGFESIEQLSLIKGIGMARLKKILPVVRID